MSRLDELIADLCPDGVEYKALGDICEIRSGWGFPNSEQGIPSGDLPFFKVGDMNNIGNEHFMITSNNYISFDTAKKLKCKPAPKGTILFPKIGAAIGTNKKRITVGECCYDNNVMGLITNDQVLYRFLFYIMESIDLISFADYSGAMPSIRKTTLEKYKIPVPPLEVQREIVRILDKFTALTAELQAELQARKKQYEHYKDSLLPFADGDVEWRPLGELCTIVRGASPRPINSFITNDPSGVNWIKIGDVAPGAKYLTECAEKITKEGARKSRRVNPGDFILSNSMSFGRPYILQIEGCIHDGWLAISDFDEYVSSDYLYHILTSSYIQGVMKQKASFGGAVQNLNANIVRSIEIPLVPKEQQERIVAVLDRFSLLCTDISSGIPAEIEARQKQYEYYRDKLLTFKEKA